MRSIENLRHWPPAGRLVGTAVAVFVAGTLGYALPLVGSRLALPWISSGIAVAALVRWGARMWVAVFIGAAAIELAHRASPIAAVGVGSGLAAAAWTVHFILRRRGFHAHFDRRGDVLTFIGAVLIGMLWSSILGVAGYTLVDTEWRRDVREVWLRWWLNNTTGALLLAPFLIAVRDSTWRELETQPFEVGLWLLGVLVCATALLAPMVGAPGLRLAALHVSALLVVWSAIRFGLVVTAFGSLLLTAAALVSAAFGIGALAGYSELAALQLVWSYAGVLTVLGLMITALLAERDRAAQALGASERRYHTLFDTNPHPVFVYDAETLHFLVVNNAAVRKYGYTRSQFLGMSLDQVRLPESEPALPAPRDDAAAEAAVESHHRTQDGRVLEVETTERVLEFDGRRAVLLFALDVTERRRLQRALLEAGSSEQRRLGQELHDGLGQELTGLAMYARSLAVQGEQAGWSITRELTRLADIASQAIRTCRSIARGLSPLSETRGGLVEALRDLTERTSASASCAVRFTVQEHAPLAIPWESRNHLFRIGQETLNNALKHARPTAVDVRLEIDPHRVRLVVSDNGRGIRAVGGTPGLGLETMRERATAIGAQLRVSAREGGGTTVVCDCPQRIPALAS